MKSLDATFKNLANAEEPISIAGLYALSSPDPAQLEQVKTVWNTLPADRRAMIMRHLIDLGEDNFEVDFSAMYRLGLADSEAAVRATAIGGLWEEADPTLIAPLMNLLQTDESDAVRAAAASALGRYIFEGELEELPEAKVRPIIAALKATHRKADESIEVRRRALEALGFLSDDDTAQLITQAYHDTDEKMRLSAVFAMGRSLDAERWGDTVVQELTAPNPELRFEAARAAGELEYPPAVRPLGDLLEDVDEEIQQIAVWSLGQIGGDKARQYLMDVLDSDAEHLHEEAEDALAELEFKADNLDLTMFDFDEEDEDDWVLDDNPDDDEDDDD